jgi:hypothetical protein
VAIAFDGGPSSAKAVTFSFSRPTGAATTVRLVATGLPALRTDRSDAGGGARCTSVDGRAVVDLRFPDALGRTATGSCVAV